MLLSRLVAFTEMGEVSGEAEIYALSADSREITQNGLFFCLTGKGKDGHAYAKEAVKNGAVAVVAERLTDANVPHVLVEDTRKALATYASAFYGFPSERMKVVAITGTNGKTTTAQMLAKILRADNKKVGVIGTLGAFYGDKRKDCGLTTPDPIALHKLLEEMYAHGVEYVIMEASAHALYYRKLSGLRLQACIFTNLSQDHLDFFFTMSEYANAKAMLFEESVCPIAVLNGDEETGRMYGALRSAKKTTYYGLYSPADAFAVVTEETLHGSRCVFNIDDELCEVDLKVTGRHNVYNALAAATCAMCLGIRASAVTAGLNAFKGAKGRLERVGERNGGQIFVDFAHTPDGLEKSLCAIKRHCKGKLICLFGCGGNRDKSKRPIMGEISAKYADFTIITSDNPRYEDPLDIISGIESGHRNVSLKYVVVPERKKALQYAIERLQTGDVLLVAGKGGEEYQEIMGIKYPFNDNDIIEKIIEEKREYSLS